MLKRSIPTILMLLGLLVACGSGSDNADSKATGLLVIGEPSATAGPGLAAVVNGQPITQETLELEIARQSSLGDLAADPDTFATEVLEKLIDQMLIEQFAIANNLVTDEAVQAEIVALTEQAAAQNLALAEIMGYPPELTEQKVREALSARALIEYLTAAPVNQVHARHILVKTETQAREILQQLEAGEDFAELAREFSKDGSTAEAGGDLGWIAPGDLMQPDVEAIIFSMPPHSRWPEPVPSVLGYHVIEVLEQDASRPLTSEQRFQYEQRAIQEWLKSQRESASIIRYVGHNRDSP